MARVPRKITPLRILAFGLLIFGMVMAIPTSIGVFNTQSEGWGMMLVLFIIGLICLIGGIVLLVITPRSRM